MKKYLTQIFILLVLSVPSLLNAQTTTDPVFTLPDSIDGWKKLGNDRLFDDKNLYEYIDGAAELYISFGFTKVFNRIYSAGDGKEIIVDIFYMNSPQDAFGAFSFSVGKIGNEFGNQSQVAPGAIVFWKNNLVVSVVENPESKEAKNVSLKIAQLIDKAILEKGSFPEVLKYLPAENLDMQSIRYFRHYVWLNTYTFISNENILNINEKTHCVLAKYGGKEKLILLIVKYPLEHDAVVARGKFIRSYYKTIRPKSVVKTKDGRYSGVDVVNNFFIAVFSGTKENDVKDLITRAKESINRLTSTK